MCGASERVCVCVLTMVAQTITASRMHRPLMNSDNIPNK